LRRRRAAGLVGGAAATVAAAGVTAVAVSLATAGPGAARPEQAAGPAGRAAATSAPRVAPSPDAAAIALVSYSGTQIPGYQVTEVPSGWVIQGGSPSALVIAPAHDPDTSIDSFTGKLVVMLKSVDEPVPVHAPRQPVAGRPGYLRVQEGTQIMTFQAANGAWVDIQAPTSLGWDGTELAQFAAGVQVLGNAQPGHG
ncbi:MAG TPA: hypothetical protein VK586_09600, partial [Streptosporangiaceae bacterium]|nr:hypothetical protein [Streptosporangiaceae bacterium]